MDPEIVPYLEELSKYLNFNRVESVVSKFPDEKNRGKLKQSVIKDILTDAGKDEIKLPDEPLRKKVLDELDKLVIKEVNSYFTQH